MKNIKKTRLRVLHKEQGFTLIEMLVVVLIIGILAAIAIAIFMNQRKAAVDATLKNDLKNAGTIYQGSYKNGSGYDPSSLTQMNKSKGNSISMSTIPTFHEGFCIMGSNESNPDDIMYYSSSDGGITDNPSGCLGVKEEDENNEEPIISSCSPIILNYINADREMGTFITVTPDYYPLNSISEENMNETQKARFKEINDQYDALEAIFTEKRMLLSSMSSEEYNKFYAKTVQISMSEEYRTYNSKFLEYEEEAYILNDDLSFKNPEKITKLRQELLDARSVVYNMWCS